MHHDPDGIPLIHRGTIVNAPDIAAGVASIGDCPITCGNGRIVASGKHPDSRCANTHSGRNPDSPCANANSGRGPHPSSPHADTAADPHAGMNVANAHERNRGGD